MATLTSDQLTDLQADLALSTNQAVFTDLALNRLYTRAAGDYETTLWLGLRQLYSAALGENDYTAGQTSEKRSQIAKNLKDALDAQWVIVSRANQVRIVGMREVPPIEKELPYGYQHPDVKNRRHNDNLPRNYRRGWWWGR